MKKIVVLLLIIVLLGGCGKEKINEIKKNKVDNEFKQLDVHVKYDIDCEEINDIVDFSWMGSLFITKDGNIYRISLNKIFSNEKNCRIIDSEKKFVKIVGEGILAEDGKLYHYNSEQDRIEPFKFDDSYYGSIMKSIKEDYKYVFYPPMRENQKVYYFDQTTKKVYLYNDKYTLEKNPLFTLEDDEEIKYTSDANIITNKNIYLYSDIVINKDECSKYADVECKYDFNFHKVEEPVSNKDLSHIKFIKLWNYSNFGNNSFFIVDEKNQVYSSILGG